MRGFLVLQGIGELLESFDAASDFVIAAFLVLIISTIWSDVSALFSPTKTTITENNFHQQVNSTDTNNRWHGWHGRPATEGEEL